MCCIPGFREKMDFKKGKKEVGKEATCLGSGRQFQAGGVARGRL